MYNTISRISKLSLLVFSVLFFIITLSIVWPGSASTAIDVRGSMVKIYCVQDEPDYDNPWNMSGPEMISGSGCIIDGNRILTNAHVVSDHTFIMVRLQGRSEKHPAKVIAVSHEADLALLSVDVPGFFAGTRPLRLGALPEIEQEVIVSGFPEGGDTLSTTKGVISRIELQRYVHSMVSLLAGQLDAAINPGNSGGPVLVGDRIVGVVMQARTKSQNIGYMVPAPVIEHFLVDVEDGRYDGFPEDGITYQELENKSLKQMYGLEENQSGTLVSAITTGSPAEGKIQPGDVLLSIDGHRIADDGTVEFRPGERTGCDFYVKHRQIGDDLEYKILRNGQMKTVRLTLNKSTESSRLVPMKRYDVQPTYFVYGGLVFCPLTLNYLLTWGDDWSEDAPYDLLAYFVNGELTLEGEEVVVIIKVLASNLNNGYGDLVNERIVEVNGIPIRNLKDLILIVEAENENPFVVFKTKGNQTIALERSKAEAAQAEILTTYRIAEDRSADLRAAAGIKAAGGKTPAGSSASETTALR